MNDIATVLLAEDREEDVILVQRAFQKGNIANPLMVVRNGEEAMNYLSGVGRFSDRAKYPLPALLILDLKMPGADGFDVLQRISTQPYLKSLRIVVLTSSENMHDVNTAYQLGATSFLVKPIDFSETVEMTKKMIDYWLKLNMASGPNPVSKVDPEPKSDRGSR